MHTFEFKTNINCGSCIKSVTPHLNQVDEIDTWQVDTENPEKILRVELEEGGPELVLEAVQNAGFQIELRSH